MSRNQSFNHRDIHRKVFFWMEKIKEKLIFHLLTNENSLFN
jgi:hypothetical protein